ncbi:hypothetical protein SM033_00010 [Vibrio phage vB_VpaM_sm033]|nr:hypothetical protein SM033_00010 [Vibrio phage vB_VpaM_sm033]
MSKTRLAFTVAFNKAALTEEQAKLLESFYRQDLAKMARANNIIKLMGIPKMSDASRDIFHLIHNIKVSRGGSVPERIRISICLEATGSMPHLIRALNALLEELKPALDDYDGDLRFARYAEDTKKIQFCAHHKENSAFAVSDTQCIEPDAEILLKKLEDRVMHQLKLREMSFARAKPTAKGGTVVKAEGLTGASVEPYEVGYDENGEAVYFSAENTQDGEE